MVSLNVSDRAFIFHIYIPWGKTLSLVPSQGHLSRSRSNIKVTVLKKNGHCRGNSVSQTQLVPKCFLLFDSQIALFHQHDNFCRQMDLESLKSSLSFSCLN